MRKRPLVKFPCIIWRVCRWGGHSKKTSVLAEEGEVTRWMISKGKKKLYSYYYCWFFLPLFVYCWSRCALNNLPSMSCRIQPYPMGGETTICHSHLWCGRLYPGSRALSQVSNSHDISSIQEHRKMFKVLTLESLVYRCYHIRHYSTPISLKYLFVVLEILLPNFQPLEQQRHGCMFDSIYNPW